MLTIKIKNKKVKILNLILLILLMCLVFYATCSLIFLIPIFNKKYTNKINTDNYSINTKTSFKNAWFNCYTNEEFKIASKDKAVLTYLEKELESDGFKKNKDKLIRRKKESGFCGNRKKEYEKVHSKTYATYKLNGSSNIKLNYNDEYKEDYVTFKINNKISNDVTINSNLNIKKIGEYIISYRLKLDNNYNVFLLRKVSIVDNEKPKINLLGENEITIDFGSNYKEFGYSATDNYDGDITDKVIVKNKVDTKKPGTYKISYKVTDTSGNTFVTYRIVNVRDKTNSVNITNPNIQIIDGITYVDGVLVVNKKYGLPKNYDPKVNKEALKSLKLMQADAKTLNLDLSLISGYRSYSTQEELYNKYVSIDGEEKANTYSAKPGFSEHQTGLSFDVGRVDSSFSNTDAAKWLEENAYIYGFIIRYPKDKIDITGYIYEPWHIRYLGKSLAKKVWDSKLTLEEYLNIN